MSQLTLNTLLQQVGSDKVTGFFLVLARVSPLFVLAPLFSSKMVPARVKGIVAVGLSIGLTPLAVHGQSIPTDPMAVAGLLVVQVLVGLAFALGGDAWTLRGLQRPFDPVPLTKAPQIATLTTGVEQAFATIFVSAVEVAAPVILALLITDVAFGMIAKVVPQVNIFGVGFPMKVGVAMLVVAASLPFLGSFMSDQISNAVLTSLHFI